MISGSILSCDPELGRQEQLQGTPNEVPRRHFIFSYVPTTLWDKLEKVDDFPKATTLVYRWKNKTL